MIRYLDIRRWALAALVVSAVAGCGDTVDALTSHSRPVATVEGEALSAQDLGLILAESPMPDSSLTGFWAASVARLWADYMVLVRLYHEPDSTNSLNYDPLLEAGRYVAALEVARYRDSIVLADIDPTDDEVRQYYERVEPFTRLDVRRIVLNVPAEASEEVLDSLFVQATEVRERVAGGADFVETARRSSDEPAAARGQTLSYQGHEDFATIADSVMFALLPGEISPVFATGDQMVFYRVERRRKPEFTSVMDIVKDRLLDERRTTTLAVASDSLLENARRTVTVGAPLVARSIASTVEMGSDRIRGSTQLVRFAGGEFTVAELREMFRARPDLQRRFTEAEDDDIELFLYQLAGDKILIDAAAASGVKLLPEDWDNLRAGMGQQLAALARRMNIFHVLVVSPQFDSQAESRRFITSVLQEAKPVAWLTEFRVVLDPVYPSRVDPRSAEVAARIAREYRIVVEPGADPVTGEATTQEAEE